VKVKLVSYTKDGEKLIAIAAKISHSRRGWREDMSPQEVETWITESFKHGYFSVFEHSSYTFSIEGISRVCSHQLVRHRIASYTQTSHRFARPVDEHYKPVVPPSATGKIEQHYGEVYEMYYDLLKKGVPEEDARYILPNGVNTNIVVTMNARELINFFGLRTCSRAQWEIRALAWMMLEEVRKVHPIIFRYAGPNCVLHENFIRNNLITFENLDQFVSERCIEGVPRQNISKCIANGRQILNTFNTVPQ
jgi:thymidylate synthase (FAD)